MPLINTSNINNFHLKKNWEYWNSNRRLLGDEQGCHLCAMQPPFKGPSLSSRNIDEEFYAAKFEEDSIKQKLANYEMDGKSQRYCGTKSW